MTDKEKQLRQWARENYRAGEPIEVFWSEAVQDECDRMNVEWALAESERNKARIKTVVDSSKEGKTAEEYKGLIIVQVNLLGSIAKSKKMSTLEINTLLANVAETERSRKQRELAAINKRLFSEKGFPELDALEKAKSDWRESVKRCGIPFGAGQTAMKTALIPRVDDIAQEIERKLPVLVETMMQAYPAAIRKDTVNSEFWNPEDYRPLETLEKLFTFRIGWFGFMPEELMLQQISNERVAANQARTAALWEEIKKDGELLLREEALAVTTRLLESLTPDEKGNKKRFYDTAVTNITQFLDDLTNRNLAGDGELEASAAKLRAALEGKKIDDFRTDDAMRKVTAVKLDTIQREFKEMVVSASSRVIKFRE